MKRRDFLKNTTLAGLAAGAALTMAPYNKSFAREIASPNAYDLVAVKGGEPDVMFSKAIEVLGGMNKFVQPNQTVVVKPNIGWDVAPERAANTHPLLVKTVVKQCFAAGAKKVYVFDNTCDDWQKCYENSGIQKAVAEAGGTMVPGNAEKYYKDVSISKGKRLTKAKVHEQILDSDVFINIPVLKSHMSARLTIAIKNLMGIVWDRRFWHRNDLHQCIADFATYERRPDLNIVDAYHVMKENGPRGVSESDVVRYKTLLVSTDMVAVDAAAAKVFGYEPDEIDYIRIAHEMGVGENDLEKLNIKRIYM